MHCVCRRDFVHDQPALGKKLRILSIVDTHPRLCPAADSRVSYQDGDPADARAGLWDDRLLKYEQGRQWQRVHLARSGSLGLHQPGHAGLFTTRKTHGQRPHRSIQQQATVGMPLSTPVHMPYGRPRKAGGLTSPRQRSQTSLCDRIQRTVRQALSRCRHRPVIVIKLGNACLWLSNVGLQSTLGRIPPQNGRGNGSQVTANASCRSLKLSRTRRRPLKSNAGCWRRLAVLAIASSWMPGCATAALKRSAWR